MGSPTSAAQELLDHESEDPDDHTLETNDNDHWGDEDQDLQLRRQHEIGTARAIDLHHITPRPLPPLPLPQLPPYPYFQTANNFKHTNVSTHKFSKDLHLRHH